MRVFFTSTRSLQIAIASGLAMASIAGNASAQSTRYIPPELPAAQETPSNIIRLQKEAEKALQRGVEALKSGDYVTAEQNFETVLEFDPDNENVNYFMALAKIGNNNKQEATKFLKTAIKSNSNFFAARETLALVSVELGDYPEAIKQRDALRAQRDKCTENSCADLGKLNLAVAKVESALRAAAQ